ncbi:hypothetical protein JB92DRAFT_2979302 [Gautieria morchelliformis]|nr:hypothetical protein JB92DRAFT_2979302 [Gautieria morchelliformis]
MHHAYMSLLMFFFPFSSAAPCPRTRSHTNSMTGGCRTRMPTPIHIHTQACRRRWSTIQGPPSCSRLSASPRIPKTTLLPSPIGIAPPLTGRHGESIPIPPPPFMLQPRPSGHPPILPRPQGVA